MSEQIPEKHVEFCKAVALLATTLNLRSVSMTFNPGWGDDWHDQISMKWEEGRHGEDRKRLLITSTIIVRAEVGEAKP